LVEQEDSTTGPSRDSPVNFPLIDFFPEIACVLRILHFGSAVRRGLSLTLIFGTANSLFAADPPPNKALTLAGIFSTGNSPSTPPQGMVWSPDGTRLTYLSDAGDLMQVEGASGTQSVLITKEKLTTLRDKPASEVDRDHRARYGQASYIWAPDSQHLLFDSSGELWYYTLSNKTAIEIGETGAGSGDDPKFSPNGKLLAYLHEHNLLLRHLQEPSTTAFSLTTSKEDAVLNGEVDWVYEEELDTRSNYFWSPDSKNIAYLQMYEAAVPKYPLTDWIPTHATVADQRYPQPGDPNPVVRVGVVNAGSGRTTWLRIPLDVGNDYIPRFGWIDAKVLWVESLTRNHKHRNLYFADIATGQVKQVLTDADEKFLDEGYDVTFHDNSFLWMSWRDGHTHIYKYDFDPGAPLAAEAHLDRQLTSGDYEVVSVKGIDSQTNTVYYLSNEGDPLQQQLWAVKLDGTGKHQVTTQAGTHSPIFSPNAKFYSDDASSMTTPPSVSMCRGETECHVFWSAPAVTSEIASPEQLQLKAADGTTMLYASLLMPAGKEKKESVPLIVNPYGGPHAQTVRNSWGGRGLLFDELLTQHGFAVLHVDNRGMGGRGRDFAQAAYHNFGPVQLADQLAAVDQVLATHKELDTQQIGWWGWSWGGTFTLYAMTHSDRIRAGVAGAPVTDWRDYDSIYTERYMGSPAENPDGYRDNSVVNSAKDLKGRLLMLHGTGDDNVHIGNTIQFIQKLLDANISYELNLYPRKTHSVSGEQLQVHEEVLRHFEMYLGKNAPGEKFQREEGAGAQ
jgi:dipeptidyl-peptidase-4